MKNPKIVRICNLVSLALILALLVCQFLPYWHTQEEAVSIQGFVWFPYNHSETERMLKGAVDNYDLNDVVTMPALMLLVGSVSIVLLTMFHQKLITSSAAAVTGVIGLTGYLSVPAFRLGGAWWLHLTLCIAIVLCVAANWLLWYIRKK